MVKKLTFLVFVFSLLPSLSAAHTLHYFNTPDECVIKNHNFHVESEWSSLVASNDIYWKICHDYIVDGSIIDSKCSEWKNSVMRISFGCDFSATEGSEQKVRTRLLKKVGENQYLIDSEEAAITVCRMSDYYTKEEVERLIDKKLSDYYNTTEIDKIKKEILSRFNNYYPKEEVDKKIEELKQKAKKLEQNITDIRSYIEEHEAEWRKDEVGGGISLHTVERWFKETWQSLIEWMESKVNWLLEKVSDLLKWRDEASVKMAELEARVRYLEKVCEKLMDGHKRERYKEIVEVMVENNLTELKVGNVICTVSDSKYVCIEKVG